MANQPSLVAKEGTPFIEINPEDAAARGVVNGDEVLVANARGWCRLRAVVTDDVLPGMAVSPKGRWASKSPDGRNVNWVTPDAIADLAGQSTFHSNLVHVRPAVKDKAAPALTGAAAGRGVVLRRGGFYGVNAASPHLRRSLAHAG